MINSALIKTFYYKYEDELSLSILMIPHPVYLVELKCVNFSETIVLCQIKI